MTKQTDTQAFACTGLPDDPGEARLLGLYPQVQEGLWMQRVKILGGRLRGRQWRALAKIARTWTPDTPLHLTTRQDIELHDLTEERVPHVQKQLHAAGISCRGACGDTLRNVTICPCSGVRQGSIDLAPLAWEVRGALESLADIESLPRKFKINLSCGDGCGEAWINDLGLIARKRAGQWGFEVIVAGSLGARPGTGLAWREWVPAEHVVPLARAAVQLFAREGDREHRRRARLRHVRERLGDETFAAMLDEALAEELHAREAHPVDLPEAPAGFAHGAALTFARGDVRADQAGALGRLAGSDALAVRLAADHRVWVFGESAETVAEAIAGEPALTEAAEPGPAVVACPGRRWCARGLAHTEEIADRLRAALAGRAGDVRIGISGCPNGCSHPTVADIGFVGGVRKTKAGREDVFHVLVGGGRGTTPALAKRVAKRLSLEEAIEETLRHVEGEGHAGD